ncbi:MAG TPA: VIT1/CCC1 transporter family protein [Candidatus Paceibacterota bacterium]|nr:VIT1/CCC1 transporter family protein [Candidatus Paceibacterota bacterium]
MKITLRDIILGGQDGLVNTLGIILGLFAAHSDTRLIIVAALAAGLSEAISMGAVSYTSGRVDDERLRSESRKQFLVSAIVVGLSALICSIIPIVPFLFVSGLQAIVAGIILSAITLFSFGSSKASHFKRVWWKSGIQLLIIGGVSATAGFIIGYLLRV